MYLWYPIILCAQSFFVTSSTIWEKKKMQIKSLEGKILISVNFPVLKKKFLKKINRSLAGALQRIQS